MKPWRIVALVAMLIVAGWLVVALAGCTQRYIPFVYFNPRNSGEVRCDQRNNPVRIISVDAALAGQESIVVLHENVHLMQIERYGGCKKFVALLADVSFQFQMEAEAYCVSTRQQIHEGNDSVKVMTNLVQYLQARYQPNLTLDSVWVLLPCGGRHYGTVLPSP